MIAEPCLPQNLSLAVGAANDDGMLHRTAYLVLINTGTMQCSVPGHPHVSLIDTLQNPVVADATTPAIAHMHPGPVIVPRNILPGEALVTEIRWAEANGDATSSACSKIATVALEGARAPLATTICGDDAPGAKPRIDVKLYGLPA